MNGTVRRGTSAEFEFQYKAHDTIEALSIRQMDPHVREAGNLLAARWKRNCTAKKNTRR
jgi:hypothetical protein